MRSLLSNDASPQTDTIEYLAIVCGFALLTSAGELLLLARRKFLLGNVLTLSPQATWMIPVANLMWFVAFALPLLVLARRWPRLRTYFATLLVWSFLSCAAVLLMLSRIHPAASVVLGAGIAYQFSLFTARRPGMRRFFSGVTPVLLIAMVGLGIATNVRLARAERERREQRGTGDPASPNVLLIIWDTVRAASLHLNGHIRDNTPNLERLASNGVSFRRAFATAPWTLPTHASLFTGRLPNELDVGFSNQPLDNRFLTLSEYLGHAGYATGGFVANVLYADREHGLSRGFERYEDYRVTIGQVLVSSSIGRVLLYEKTRFVLSAPLRTLNVPWPGRKNARMVTDGFLAWVDRQEGRPFHAFLNYFDAHEPYAPPDSIAQRYLSTITVPSRMERAKHRFTRKKPDGKMLAYDLALYEAAIADLDAELGRLIRELESRGMLENTIVIVTSDHGEEFGEDGRTGHASNVNVWQTHVPLVLSYVRAVPRGLTIDEPVSLRDVTATIAELVGDTARPFPGTSLADAWRRAESFVPSPAISELQIPNSPHETSQAIRHDGFSYVRTLAGDMRLFRLADDPGERKDLSGTATLQDTVKALSALFPPLKGDSGSQTLQQGRRDASGPGNRQIK